RVSGSTSARADGDVTPVRGSVGLSDGTGAIVQGGLRAHRTRLERIGIPRDSAGTTVSGTASCLRHGTTVTTTATAPRAFAVEASPRRLGARQSAPLTRASGIDRARVPDRDAMGGAQDQRTAGRAVPRRDRDESRDPDFSIAVLARALERFAFRNIKDVVVDRLRVAPIAHIIAVAILLLRIHGDHAIVADIAYTVAIAVFLLRIRGTRAVVADVSDAVPVGVALRRVLGPGTIVTCVSHPVPIGVVLRCILGPGTIVTCVAEPIAIRVVLRCVLDPGTIVTCVSHFVPVGVLLQ